MFRDRTDEFNSIRDASREARIALWGDVPFSQRPCLYPEPGTYGIYVVANVNGHLILIDFDNYGRQTSWRKIS